MIIPPEIVTLLWFVGISAVSYLFFHRFSDVIKEKIKTSSTKRKHETKESESIDGQFDQMIKNSPTLLAKINQEIEAQREKGVSDTQMKGLIDKKSMLDFVVNNKEIVDIIGKPIIKKLLGWVKNL